MQNRSCTPTLEAFSKEFMDTYVTANNKASEVASKSSILKAHLLPALGDKRLDEIGGRDLEAYKASRLKAGLAAKTVNNHLAVLGRLLRVAQKWG